MTGGEISGGQVIRRDQISKRFLASPSPTDHILKRALIALFNSERNHIVLAQLAMHILKWIYLR